MNKYYKVLLGIFAIFFSLALSSSLGFASTTYLVLYNKNTVPVNGSQLRINVLRFNIKFPIESITVIGTNESLLFCYEWPDGSCNETVPPNPTGYIWIKLPYIPAKGTVYLKIIHGTSHNGAVNGKLIFPLYEDFNEGLNTSLWSTTGNVYVQGGYLILEVHGMDYASVRSRILFPDTYKATIKLTIETDNSYTLSKTTIGFGGTVGGRTVSYSLSIVPLIDRDRNKVFVRHEYSWLTDTGSYSTDMQIYELPYSPVVKITYVITFLRQSPTYNAWYINGVLKHKVTARLSNLSSFGISVRSGKPEYYWKVYVDYIRVYNEATNIVVLPAYGTASYNIQSYTTNTARLRQVYEYVRRISVIATNKYVSITNVAIPIVINTQELISQGKMKPDCSDIYITYYDPIYGEQPVPFWVDPTTCNTPNTIIWVKVPRLSVSNDLLLYIYYGSALGIPFSDPYSTFMYFVDFSNLRDVQNKLTLLFPAGTTYQITSQGMIITTGSSEAGLFTT